MNINKQIKADLLEEFSRFREGVDTKAGIYRKIGSKYGVHPERVRKHHRTMSGYTEPATQNTSFSKSVDNRSGVIQSTVEADFDPKNEQELADLHKIDLSRYSITNYWSKVNNSGKFTSSIFCKLKSEDTDLNLQKEVLLKELKDVSPEPVKINRDLYEKNCLLEIAIPDIHFGKLSHAEESGEDYDLKIAGNRFTEAIDDILSNTNLSTISRILFPIGNDMFNVDNMNSTTTGGTPQDTDTRFHKMVVYVKNILIQSVLKLKTIAPVDVLVVPGNHDEQSAFMLGEILDAYFHNDPDVFVDNSPKLRKYYQFGKNSILLTHGDKEKHSNLGMIFAAENPRIWADTSFRFIQLGHYHHNKKINYLYNDEFQGFQIQILPSLSPNDKWHYGKGFISLKQAKGFIFHKDKGLVSEITFTIK